MRLGNIEQSGNPMFDELADGTLMPHDVPPASDSWATGFDGPSAMPWLANDTAQRPTHMFATPAGLAGSFGVPVGEFDPSRLYTGDTLSTSVETYTQAQAVGSDQRSRDLLHGQPLLPNSNPGGYLAQSPTVLMSLATLWQNGVATDDISAVRVRVAGVTGFDALSRERVRLAADEIAAATGLDVEVLLGASGAPQTIDLEAGRFGRPELTLGELWSQKGVAAAIVRAVDTKSVILFGLILVVCLLFLTNAATAGVRARRPELAILSCLGWSRRRIAATVMGEVGVIGLIAGLAGAVLTVPLARLLQVDMSLRRAFLAVPVALLLCAAAATVPAWRASRAHPAAAMRPPAVAPGRLGGRPHRRVVGLAMANLRRTPGRNALGAVALAVGTAGLAVVAAIIWAFDGTITGTVLGDAISIRVRGVDLVAVTATVVLGVIAVADVLYLNVRERGAEFAALRAIGWSDAALSRLIAYEGLGISLFGALAGAVGGLSATTLLIGRPTPGLMWTVGATAIVGVLVGTAAAVVPVWLLRRIPISMLLAEE